MVTRRAGNEGRNSAAKATALKVGVIGCAGRMGQMLVRTVAANDRCLVVGGSEQPRAAAVGRDLGLVAGIDALGVSVTDDPAELFTQADAVLEFTSPAATVQHVEFAAKKRRSTSSAPPASNRRRWPCFTAPPSRPPSCWRPI